MKSKIFYVISLSLLVTRTVSVPTELPKYNGASEDYCTTAACQLTGGYILQSMNATVDKCKNFYQFACGAFQEIPLDDSIPMTSTLKLSQATPEKLLQDNILQNENNTNEIEAFKKMRKFHNICYNDNGKNSDYSEILENFDNWPVFVGDSWEDSKFSWTNISLQFNKMGLLDDYLISYKVDIDVKNNSISRIFIDQASLGLSEKYFNDNKIVDTYKKYMVAVSVLLGAEKLQAEKDFQKVLEFEMELGKIVENEVEHLNQNLAFNLETIQNLQTKYPFIQWLDYLKEIFHPHADINETKKIVVLAPSYLNNLETLLKNTTNRTLANYAFWRMTERFAEFLNDDIRGVKEEFDYALKGINPPDPWFSCFYQVLEYFPLVMGSIYVRNHVNPSTKAKVLEMLETMRSTYSNIIDETDWMNSETKQKAKDKLYAMIPEVAYPDELLDDDKINDYYNELQIQDNYFKTILNIKKFKAVNNLKRLRKPVARVDWTKEFGSAYLTYAYYDTLGNAMVIPSGIMQELYFDVDRPMVFNYAYLGFVIGHEMTHGFDSTGRFFDKNGNKFNWWDSESEEKYNETVKEMIEEYNQYTVNVNGDLLHVNGERTVGENIADKGGLNLAYKAYRKWEIQHGKGQLLAGFEDYTEEQIFWLAYANSMCQKIRPEALRETILLDEHAPEEIRVLGALSNSEEFARDFKCS